MKNSVDVDDPQVETDFPEDGYSHDAEVGAIYVQVRAGNVDSTRQVESILVDLDANGRILGVEILDDEMESLPCDWIVEELGLDDDNREDLNTASLTITRHCSDPDDLS